MTQAITLQRDHLRSHRRMIIARSIAAAAAGAVPIPMLDSRLAYMVQRSTLRKLAAASMVDVNEAAFQSFVHGVIQPPSLIKLAGGTLAFRALSRTWRKTLIAYMATKRAQAAANYFLRATLFDHYCAKLHVGLGLTSASALELRKLVDEAIEQTPGGIGRRLFRRGLIAAARATVRAPVELLDIASRGALRRLLARNPDDAIEAADEIDAKIEEQMRSQSSFLARATTAIELQLSVESNPYLDQVVDTFERLWREHTHDGS